MKQKVLFIDYTFQRGHVNFNRIHIAAIKSAGYDVRLILHSDIADHLDYPNEDYILKLPRCLNQRQDSPILNRVIYLIILFWIKIKVINFSKYSYVVVSSCDEPTLGILPLCRNMYIMCHNTASVYSKVKCFFLKRLAKHNTFLVFDEYMKKPFVENGIKSVKIISHGCVAPYGHCNDENLPTMIKGFGKLIFHPSSRVDSSFVDNLVADDKLCEYLQKNDILLLIHGDKEEYNNLSDNIQFISGFLPIKVYQAIFMKADIILLVYPSTFQNQVSGVSFECVANRKNILVREHPALTYCRDFYNYDPLFKNNEELLYKILKLTTDTSTCCCRVSVDTLIPNYKEIFN